MRVHRSSRAWLQYVGWQREDAKIVEKINDLIANIAQTPFKGLGKPEPLKAQWQGWWSRRITDEHRLVYRVRETGEQQHIEIAQCRYHY
jgi:toxin YoeB